MYACFTLFLSHQTVLWRKAYFPSTCLCNVTIMSKFILYFQIKSFCNSSCRKVDRRAHQVIRNMNLKFSLLVICVLCLIINLGSDASTIRNTFVDNISTGLKLAEKLLGKNSRRFPTFSHSHNVKPLPGISNNVADLVSQSFAPAVGNGKRVNTRQDAITIGETPELPGPMDSNIMGGMLRLLGLDSTKIGAAAVNGIVFIAQMVKYSVNHFMNYSMGKMWDWYSIVDYIGERIKTDNTTTPETTKARNRIFKLFLKSPHRG